jgi:protease-4
MTTEEPTPTDEQPQPSAQPEQPRPAQPQAAPASAAAASAAGPSVIVQNQREGMGRVFGRAIIQSTVWTTVLSIGLTLSMVVSLLVTVAFFAALGSAGSDNDSPYEYLYGNEDSKDKILAIPVSGVILGSSNGESGGLFGSLGAAYGYDIKQQLLDAADDDSIDGVILVMDTPGGTIYGSQAISDGVRAYKDATKKPVYAWVASMSASGGMMAMTGADRILADHGTLIGSIGVRIGPFEFYDKVKSIDGGLLGGGVDTFNGISFTEITAGRGKDLGSPYRQLTEEERAVLQRGVDNNYATFVSLVAKTRKLEPDFIREKVGALVYDELSAKQLGLIDDIANMDDAYAQVARAARLRGTDWQIVQPKQQGGGLLGLLAQAGITSAPKAQTRLLPSLSSCLSTTTQVAYYGDLAELCRK